MNSAVSVWPGFSIGYGLEINNNTGHFTFLGEAKWIDEGETVDFSTGSHRCSLTCLEASSSSATVELVCRELE
jgi:hypothetical protein